MEEELENNGGEKFEERIAALSKNFSFGEVLSDKLLLIYTTFLAASFHIDNVVFWIPNELIPFKLQNSLSRC